MDSASDGAGQTTPSERYTPQITAQTASSTGETSRPDAPVDIADTPGNRERAAIVRATGHIIWRADQNGVWWVANPDWSAYTGQPAGITSGWGWLEAVHPDDRERLRVQWLEAVHAATPATYTSEFRVRRYDGEYRYMLSRATPVIEDGHVREWTGFSVDITKQRQHDIERAETLARDHATRTEAEARVQELAQSLEVLNDAVIVFDTRGQIRHANASARNLFAPMPGLLRPGISIGERFGHLQLTKPDGTALRLDEWPVMRILHGETISRNDAPTLIMSRPDGYKIYVRVGGGPIHDAEGHITGVICVCTDLTHQHQLEHSALAHANWLEAIIDTVQDSVIVFDTAGRPMMINTAGRGLFDKLHRGEWTSADIAARGRMAEMLDTHGHRIPPEEWPSQRVLRGEVLVDDTALDVIMPSVDGGQFILNMTGAPLRDEQGNISAAVVVIRDVSERWRLEREITERAGELEAILEASVDSILVYDADGRVLYANTSAQQHLGLHISAMKQSAAERSLLERLFSENGDQLSVDEWPLARVLRGEVLKGNSVCTIILRNAAGQTHFLEISGAPIRDAQGEIIRAMLVARDVTDRHQQERRTHESISALLDVAQALVEPAYTSEKLGLRDVRDVHETARRLAELTRSLLGCTRAAIASVDPQTVEMRPLGISGFSPEETEHWWNSWNENTVLSDRFGAQTVARLRLGDVVVMGRERPEFAHRLAPYHVAHMVLAPMTVGDQLTGTIALDFGGRDEYSSVELSLASSIGKVVGLVIERERLLYEWAAAQANELALRQANQRMDDFLGIASHELRTPLTTIKANIQMMARLRARMAHGVPTREDLLIERTERQVNRLTRLVDDLVDVSRIHVGPLDLHRAEADLTVITREAVEEQRLAVPERIITYQCPHTSIRIFADADRTAQVITNFLTNALKYSPAEKPVHVMLTVEDGSARLAVRDFGPGLRKEERSHVWDLFYRAPGIEVQSGSGVGLGLGLHICKTIIERHGGEVGIDSVPGEGSTFWFRLPLL